MPVFKKCPMCGHPMFPSGRYKNTYFKEDICDDCVQSECDDGSSWDEEIHPYPPKDHYLSDEFIRFKFN